MAGHRLEKTAGVIPGWSPRGVKIGTAFQNCFQLLIGIETMNNGKKHETCLNNTEREEQGNTGRHGEGSEKRNHKDHGVKKLKMLLKGFVLQLST